MDRLTDVVTFDREVGRSLRGRRLGLICSGTDAAPPQGFAEPFALTAKYLGMAFRGVHYAQFRDSQPALPGAATAARGYIVEALRNHLV